MALISIITFIIMLIIAKPWRTYFYPKSNNVCKGVYVFFLLYLSTCVFAFWAEDTYHSWDLFIEAGKYDNFQMLIYEEIYNWLAGISQNNYFLWRLYIWLPACIFLLLVAKRLDLLHRNMLSALMLFGAMLSYTRGMLGHSMLLFGVVLLLDKKSNVAIKILGIVFCCVSYYFHKSMYVNIIFALLAFLPMNKKTFIISLVAFPFLTMVATLLVNNIISGVVDISLADGVGGVGDRTALYVGGGKRELNINGMIFQVIRIIPEYLVLFYLVNRIVYKKYFKGLENERVFTYLFRLSYVAIYIASLFVFVDTSSWIYLRFKYMAFFPLPFVLAKVWSLEPRTNNWVKCIIFLQISVLFLGWFFILKNW